MARVRLHKRSTQLDERWVDTNEFLRSISLHHRYLIVTSSLPHHYLIVTSSLPHRYLQCLSTIQETGDENIGRCSPSSLAMMAAQADRQELRHCRMRSWFRGGLGTWHTASKSVSSRRAANMKVSTGICIDPGIPPALSENSLANTSASSDFVVAHLSVLSPHKLFIFTIYIHIFCIKSSGFLGLKTKRLSSRSPEYCMFVVYNIHVLRIKVSNEHKFEIWRFMNSLQNRSTLMLSVMFK